VLVGLVSLHPLDLDDGLGKQHDRHAKHSNQ